MNDTVVTLVGNVATEVEFRESAAGKVARFRFAVPARRWDRRNASWADGPTSFYTVWAWRTLGANLASSVSVGEPLVVHGRLRVREEERDGRWRTFVDIDAASAGHDLARGTSAFRRLVRGPGELTGHQAGVKPGQAPADGPGKDVRPQGDTRSPVTAPAEAASRAPLPAAVR